MQITQIMLLLGLALGAVPSYAKDRNATIKKATITQKNDQQAVINFTFDKPVKYKIFTLKSPNRVVIDLEKTTGNVKLPTIKSAIFSKLRHATRNTSDLRIVLDVKKAVTLKTSMKGKQLSVALLTAKPSTKPSAKSSTKPAHKAKPKKAPKSSPTIVPTRPRRGDFVVAIDAGHGGKDPGALGARGSREKDIVLQIAKRLKARVDRTRGMRGVLIRDADYYVPLRKRMEIARKNHADLFVSIHADANPNRHLTGSSVYILSQNGASSEAARWLASKENNYENKLGNTSLHGKDNTLATMLMDLSQAATIDNSLTLAKNTLRELGTVTRLLHRKVESAAFVVLKSPDIPSMLVETAFISNPAEERRLNTAQYQNKLASAVFNGIKRFQVVHAPGGKLKHYAQRAQRGASRNKATRHVVKSGESLSVIAQRYGVSENKLSRHNRLTSTHIRIGQKLYIPTSS